MGSSAEVHDDRRLVRRELVFSKSDNHRRVLPLSAMRGPAILTAATCRTDVIAGTPCATRGFRLGPTNGPTALARAHESQPLERQTHPFRPAQTCFSQPFPIAQVALSRWRHRFESRRGCAKTLVATLSECSVMLRAVERTKNSDQQQAHRAKLFLSDLRDPGPIQSNARGTSKHVRAASQRSTVVVCQRTELLRVRRTAISPTYGRIGRWPVTSPRCL